MDTDDTGPTSNDQLTVTLPANLTAQIDGQVGTAFVDRDDFMRSAVRHYLDYIRQSQDQAPSDVG